MLALFCYILTSGLFKFMGDSTTHPILSMLLTHTISGPPMFILFKRKSFFQSAVYEIRVSLLLVREIQPVRVEFYNNSYIK